jgi:hypothetical protein
MVNLFFKNKRFKQNYFFSNAVKLLSFRRHAFTSYFGLFIRFSLLYLNRVYLLLQSTRLFNLFFFIFLSKQSIINYLNPVMPFFSLLINNCYYFNLGSLSVRSVLSTFIPRGTIHDIFFFLKTYFYNFFVIFSLFNFSYMNLVSLPKNSKVFTILRSPHTDKKSREQFHLVMSSKLFVDTLGLTSVFLKNLNNLYLSSLFVRLSEKNSYFY